MSDPEYELRLHSRAQKELANVTGQPGQMLVERLREAKTYEQPTKLNYIKQLEDHQGLLALKVDGYRALLTLDKPVLKVLLVDTRSRVYGRIKTAKKRGNLD